MNPPDPCRPLISSLLARPFILSKDVLPLSNIVPRNAWRRSVKQENGDCGGGGGIDTVVAQETFARAKFL